MTLSFPLRFWSNDLCNKRSVCTHTPYATCRQHMLLLSRTQNTPTIPIHIQCIPTLNTYWCLCLRVRRVCVFVSLSVRVLHMHTYARKQKKSSTAPKPSLPYSCVCMCGALLDYATRARTHQSCVLCASPTLLTWLLTLRFTLLYKGLVKSRRWRRYVVFLI